MKEHSEIDMAIKSELNLAPTAPTYDSESAAESLSQVSQRSGLDRLAEQLEELRDLMGIDLAALEADLQNLGGFSQGEESRDLAERAAQHLLERPGKRIRPLCLLLGAQLADLKVDEGLRDMSVAAELVHAATLLHDDVLDEGTERRGAAASRMVFGNSASILAGDYLLIEALERVQRGGAGFPGGGEVLVQLLRTIREMVAAEAEQLERRGRFEPSRDAYLRIIEGKTASLFKWALQAGAIASRKPDSLVHALGKVGLAIGMAFQLVDDLLDISGDAAEFGKDLFADLEQGKLTWPVIIACEQDPTIKDEVAALYGLSQKGELDTQALCDLVERIRSTDALEATRALARKQQRIAEAELQQVPEGMARNALETVIAAAVERSR